MNSHLVVLTCSLVPNTTRAVALADPGLRLGQYASALGSWASSARSAFDILWIDNSTASAASLHAVRRSPDTVKILQRPELSCKEGEGKGNGEARMIDAAVDWAVAAGHYDFVTKCTGRLFVRNFHRVVRADTRTIQAGLRSDLMTADSRLFSAPLEVFRNHFSSMDMEIQEEYHVYMEHILARRILRAIADGVPFTPWPALPAYQGMSGSTGETYDSVFVKGRRLAGGLHRRISRARNHYL